MKYDNVKIGMIVKVKSTNKSFYSSNVNMSGKVIKINKQDGEFKVLVYFGDNSKFGDHVGRDSGNAEDLKYKDKNGNLFTKDMLELNNE